MNVKKSPEKSFAAIALIVTIAVIVVLLWLFGVGNWFWIWLLSWSVTAFLFYGFDKAQAKRGGWRVPEIVLHGLSLIGGFVGAFLGMQLFRHKTQKSQFLVVILTSALLWVLGWWFLIR